MKYITKSLDSKLFNLNNKNINEIKALKTQYWETFHKSQSLLCIGCENCLFQAVFVDTYYFNLKYKLKNRRNNKLYILSQKLVDKIYF